MKNTYLAPESDAYPHGGQTRKCRAFYPDGKVRTVYCGIPDTYFSIPARGRIRGKYVSGYLTIQDDSDKPNFGELEFRISSGG